MLLDFLFYTVTMNCSHISDDSKLASRQESPSPPSRGAFRLCNQFVNKDTNITIFSTPMYSASLGLSFLLFVAFVLIQCAIAQSGSSFYLTLPYNIKPTLASQGPEIIHTFDSTSKQPQLRKEQVGVSTLEGRMT